MVIYLKKQVFIIKYLEINLFGNDYEIEYFHNNYLCYYNESIFFIFINRK